MTGNTGIMTQITDIFSALSSWLVGSLQDVTALFYTAETGLTLFGILALIGLGISVGLLVVNIVKSAIRLK